MDYSKLGHRSDMHKISVQALNDSGMMQVGTPTAYSGSPAAGKIQSPKISSLRLFVVLNVLLITLFVAGISVFHNHMSSMEGPQTISMDPRSTPDPIALKSDFVAAVSKKYTDESTGSRAKEVYRNLQRIQNMLPEGYAVKVAKENARSAGTFIPEALGTNAALNIAGVEQPETTWEGKDLWFGKTLDLDDIVRARAEVINDTYWKDPGAKTWWNKPGYHLSYLEQVPPYPFQRVRTEDGKDTGVMLMIAPFYDLDYYRSELARAFFWRMKANGHIMMGISSYQEFPGTVVNPHDDRHTVPQDQDVWNAMDGWLHCFRDPDAFLPPGVPRIGLSESDFHNPDRRDDGGSLVPWGLPKLYDVVYSNQGGDWNDFARNWTLAKECIKLAVAELNVTFLILGRDLNDAGAADIRHLVTSGNIVSKPKALWRDFLKHIESSRAIMTPNVHDASPRVLVEALSLDVPVLVNRHIVGGWKYVTDESGEDFGTAREFVDALRRLRDPTRKARLRPREWYKRNWGYYRASLYFQAFLELAVGPQRMAEAKKLVQKIANR